jgi:Fe-S-cluster containining protein
MRDGPVRRGIKRVALSAFLANRLVDRALRRRLGDRPHRLVGSCARCGQCCERPAIRANLPVWYLRGLRWLFLAWQRRVNGLDLIGAEAQARLFIFRCTHFDPATRRCDSYDSRPGICRDYPRELLFWTNPELLPGCGYQLLHPRAEALGAVLASLDLTSAQRAKLEAGLHVGIAGRSGRTGEAGARKT